MSEQKMDGRIEAEIERQMALLGPERVRFANLARFVLGLAIEECTNLMGRDSHVWTVEQIRDRIKALGGE